MGDRVGFHHVMLVVGVWPVLLHLATDLWAGLRPVNRDIQDRLYSRFAYICTKVYSTLYATELSVYSAQVAAALILCTSCLQSLSKLMLIFQSVYSALVAAALFLSTSCLQSLSKTNLILSERVQCASGGSTVPACLLLALTIQS